LQNNFLSYIIINFLYSIASMKNRGLYSKSQINSGSFNGAVLLGSPMLSFSKDNDSLGYYLIALFHRNPSIIN
jgi:hypothetical protein